MESIEFNQEKFNREFLISIIRIIFYYLVIYIFLMLGMSTIVQCMEEDYFDGLKIAATFLPFIFIYSSIFELANTNNFPHSEKGEIAWKHYLLGNKFALGWSSILVTISFVFFSIMCINSNLMPAHYIISIPPLIPIALTVLMFANKYKYLQKERGEIKKNEKFGCSGPLKKTMKDFFQHSIFRVKLILISAGALFLLISFFSILATCTDAGPQVKKYILPLMIIFAIIALFMFIGEIIGFLQSHTKKYLFERPLFREPIIVTSILISPYLLGIYSACYQIGISDCIFKDFNSFIAWLLPQNLAIILMIFAVGVVLDLLRYLGNYKDSFLYREKSSISDVNQRMQAIKDRYDKSLRNYIVIFAIVFSLCPMVYFFSEFSIKFIILILPLLSLIGFVVIMIKPYNPAESEDLYEPGESFLMFLKRICLQRSTKFKIIRSIGFLFMPIILFVASHYMQTYPFLLEKKGANIQTIISNQEKYPGIDLELLKNIIRTRDSDSYDTKKFFFSEQLQTKDSPLMRNFRENYVTVFSILRFKEFDKHQLFEDAKSLLGQFIDFKNVKTNTALNDHHSMMQTIIGGFITIIVALLLSTIITDKRNKTIGSLPIVIGVCLQAIVVGAICFFYYIKVPPTHQTDTWFNQYIYEIASRLYDSTDALYLATFYILFSLCLLVIAAFSNYLLSQEN